MPTLWTLALALLPSLFPTPNQSNLIFPPAGRWEIVHTGGDNISQTSIFPGGFSVFLNPDGTGYTFGTFAQSFCVVDAETNNVAPTWTRLDDNQIQITIAINNLGQGPNLSFVYTGTFDADTPIPGDPSRLVPTIRGTYFPIGDASLCSNATQASPGTFVATLLPIISSGSASGTLDAFTADHTTGFDTAVNTTVSFTVPPLGGQIAGTVSLSSNPSFTGNACFATTNGVVNPLTINPNRSSQSGDFENLFAEGLDPFGVPTTLFLNGFSANIYTTTNNTDPYAIQIGQNEWAVEAALGDDNPAAGVNGVKNDGSNTNLVMLYGVIGGACDGAGGVDSPFRFIPERQKTGIKKPAPPSHSHPDKSTF